MFVAEKASAIPTVFAPKPDDLQLVELSEQENRMEDDTAIQEQ